MSISVKSLTVKSFFLASAVLAAATAVSSCTLLGQQSKPDLSQTATFVSATPPPPRVTAPPPEAYTLFYEKNDYRLSLYEPKDGCYAGAGVLLDQTVGGDIAAFERLTAPQAMYMREMNITDPFPRDWVLNCVSNLKTPVVLLRTVVADPPDDASLTGLARMFGEYYFPIFVAFAPVDQDCDAAGYKELFRRAHDIFRQYASNCTFVWCVSQDSVFGCANYYPGDDYADWVCVNVSEKLDSSGAFDDDPINALNYFYLTYQKQKPVMLIAAVSHYTSLNYAYQTDAAVRELRRIYDGARAGYPRVKAIIYNDYNAAGQAPQETPADTPLPASAAAGAASVSADDFSITDDDSLTRAYRDITGDIHFQTIVDIMSNGSRNTELMRSAFPAYRVGGKFYIGQSSLAGDIGINGVGGYVQAKLIDGDACYDMDDIQYCGVGSFSVDEARKTLTFHQS